MLNKIRKNYFSFKGRIPRKPFIITIIIIFIIQLVSNFIMGLMQNNLFLKSILGIIILLSTISQLSFTTRRLHDLNKSGWILFGMFIIIAVLGGFAGHYRTLAGTTYLDLLQSKVSVSIAKQSVEKFLSISQNLTLAGAVINIVFFLYLSIKKGTIGENAYELVKSKNKEAIK